MLDALNSFGFLSGVNLHESDLPGLGSHHLVASRNILETTKALRQSINPSSTFDLSSVKPSNLDNSLPLLTHQKRSSLKSNSLPIVSSNKFPDFTSISGSDTVGETESHGFDPLLHGGKQQKQPSYIEKTSEKAVKASKSIKLTDHTQVLEGSVGTDNRFDLYRFKLTADSSFHVKTQASNNSIDLELMDSQGQAIREIPSLRRGKNKTMNTTLDSGIYYVRVLGRSSSTNYKLSLSTDAGSSFRDAQPVSLTANSKVFKNSIGGGDWADSYHFQLAQNSIFNLNLKGLQDNADVELLNASGQLVKTSRNFDQKNEAIKTPLNAGTYYVKVLGLSGTTPYQLKLSADSDPTKLALNTARAITLTTDASTYQGRVTTADTDDFYSFKVGTATPFNLALIGMSMDANVKLFDRSGATVASSSSPGNSDESINLAALAAGDYFIQVYDHIGDTDYQLQVSTASPSNLLPIETEVGKLTSTQTFDSTLNSSNTTDTYHFSLDTAQPFNLALTKLVSDADVQLLKSDGNVVSSSDQTGSSDESINLTSLAAGNYFVRVSHRGGDTSYHLQLSNAFPSNLLSTEIEVGKLNSTQTFDSSLSDNNSTNTYHFSLDTAQPFNLALTHLTDDADVQLVKSGGNVVASSAHTGKEDESLNLASIAAGDYFVRVYERGGNTNYQLQLSTTSPSDLLPIETEVGKLSRTRTFNGLLGDNNTIDVYHFNIDSLYFNLALTHLSNDADVQLLNSDGKVIASSRNTGKLDESINLAFSTTGNYRGDCYVRVYQYSGSTPYTLQLSVANPSDLLPTETDIGMLSDAQTFHASLSESNTTNVYRFELSTDSSLNIALTGLTDDASLRLIEDFNNNGIIDIAEQDSYLTTNINDKSINLTKTRAGTYFVQVYYYTSPTNYTLQLSTANPSNLLPVEVDAGVLNGTKTFSGSVSEYHNSDIYHFNLNAASPFDLTLTGLDDAASFRLIQDTNNNKIIEDSDVLYSSDITKFSYKHGDNGDRFVQFPTLTAGNYFVQVIENGYGVANYDLSLSTGDWFSSNLKDAGIIGKARTAFAKDRKLSFESMEKILFSTEDNDIVDANEFHDLQTLLINAASFIPDDYVRILTNKVVNGDPANVRSGIGNLQQNSDPSQMGSLVGKWFLGIDVPVALSTDRKTQYNYRFTSGQLFQDGISYQDVMQRYVGDCYFLASLGAIALRTPQAIQDMFIDNGDDTFTVRFFNHGVADYVTVNRLLPTNAAPTDTAGHSVFAGWGRYDPVKNGHTDLLSNDPTNELWVALAEKAYAQINEAGWIGQDNTNSYQGINGGQPYNSLSQITGQLAVNSDVDHRFLGSIGKEDIGRIADQAVGGGIVVLNTPKLHGDADPSTGERVDGPHSYALISYSSENERFTIYNPWGHLYYPDRGELLNNFSSWDLLTSSTADDIEISG